MMSRARKWLFPISFIVLAGLNGCRDRGPAEPGAQQPVGTPPPGLSISEPVNPSGAGAALSGAAGGLVYISAAPGTFPDGVEVTVTNLASGESVSAEIQDGGFDPITVKGEPNDELEIAVRNVDGSVTLMSARVSGRKRPTVLSQEGSTRLSAVGWEEQAR